MVSLKTDVNLRMLQAFRKGAVVILIGKIKNFFSNKKLAIKIKPNKINSE